MGDIRVCNTMKLKECMSVCTHTYTHTICEKDKVSKKINEKNIRTSESLGKQPDKKAILKNQ